MVGPSDGKGSGDAWMGSNVPLKGAVDLAFLGRAFLPDAGVGTTFDENWMIIARYGADVAGEDCECGVPGYLPSRVGARELWSGCDALVVRQYAS